MKLVVCGSCARHAKAESGACPFCGATLGVTPDAPARSRARRAVLLAGAAAVSVACTSAVALYGAPAPPPDDGGTDAANKDSGPMAFYGGPPVDASSDADAAPMGAYGGPPTDAGNG